MLSVLTDGSKIQEHCAPMERKRKKKTVPKEVKQNCLNWRGALLGGRYWLGCGQKRMDPQN